jgi:hypothetical protein
MLLRALNKEWTFPRFARGQLLNILEITDYANYSHDQEKNGFYFRKWGEILSQSAYMTHNLHTKSLSCRNMHIT